MSTTAPIASPQPAPAARQTPSRAKADDQPADAALSFLFALGQSLLNLQAKPVVLGDRGAKGEKTPTDLPLLQETDTNEDAPESGGLLVPIMNLAQENASVPVRATRIANFANPENKATNPTGVVLAESAEAPLQNVEVSLRDLAPSINEALTGAARGLELVQTDEQRSLAPAFTRELSIEDLVARLKELVNESETPEGETLEPIASINEEPLQAAEKIEIPETIAPKREQVVWTSPLHDKPPAEAKTATFVQQVREISEFLATKVDGTVRVSAQEIQAELKLYPPDLGRVRVEMSVMQDKSVQARFIVEKPETAQLLNQNLRQFRETLGQQGMTVDKVQVSMETRNVRESARSSEFYQEQRGQQSESQGNHTTDDSRRRENRRDGYRAWEEALN